MFKKFWNLKSIGIKENQKSMYQELSDKTCINKEGPYEVNLPFKISHPVLPDNFEQCKKCFESKFNQVKKRIQNFFLNMMKHLKNSKNEELSSK